MMPVKIDPTKTKPGKELKHTSPLVGCRFDPSGKFVFASAQDNSLQRWEIASGKKTPFPGHNSWVRGIAFSKDGKTLFSADWTGKILVWAVDGDKPEPRQTIQAHTGWARALAVSPDGKRLASVGNDGRASLWNVADGKAITAWAAHESHVYNVAFHPDGKSLATADLKGIVKHWSVEGAAAPVKPERELDAKVLHKYDATFMAEHGGVRSMTFSADGALLACAGITNVSNAFAGIGNPLVVLFDWKTGQRKQLLKPKAAFQGTMWGVAFHPAGYVLGTAGGNGGQLYFWQADRAESVHMVALPNNARDLDVHPDGTKLAIPFFDGAVRLYDLGA
jgi:WD40 repeat protein